MMEGIMNSIKLPRMLYKIGDFDVDFLLCRTLNKIPTFPSVMHHTIKAFPSVVYCIIKAFPSVMCHIIKAFPSVMPHIIKAFQIMNISSACHS